MAFTDSAVSVVTEIAKSLVVPIGRQLGYALFYEKNIQDLRSEVEKLRDARLGLQNQRDAALYNGEVVKATVGKWIDAAKTEEEKVNAQLQGCMLAKKSCFFGWIPNPKTRYVIGRKAKKATLSIQELHGDGSFQAIAHPDVPEGVLARLPTLLPNLPTVEGAVTRPTTNQDDVFQSRTSLLNSIIESLMDANISVVGVHGPGGVGKTTLMKQLVNRIKTERLFDEVAMAIVSENADVKNIQGELGDMLGLNFTNESVKGRAFHLQRRLQNSEKKKVLIILDDLWKELDLEEVGIPHNKGLIKLLLTSRSLDVLSRKMNSLPNFSVEGLKDDEPWELFRRMVGDRADDPNMKPIAVEMVQKCSGLPIMLKALATTLKNSEFSRWEDALEQLRSSKDVYSSLELSYNNLEGEELKHLFLLCSLFGGGQTRVEELLRYAVGLGFLEGVNTMKKARDRLGELLYSLQASSLLLENDNSDYIRIHDIVREVAVTIASRDRHVIVVDDSHKLQELRKEKIKKSTAISLPYYDVTELPEGLQCPDLKILLYFGKRYSSHGVPDSFFEGMPQLQVMDFTWISFNSLPSSIQSLENLTTLCVHYCTVEDVTIIGKLKRLQILSFNHSSISHLPKEIAQLSELRTLDLRNCLKLEKIEPGVLKSLARLEELYMENGFTKWEKEGTTNQSNARLSELNSMCGLSTLDILIPHATLLPEVLPFANLFKYRILVGDGWDWSGDHKESRTLKLKLESRDALLQNWVQGILPRTHDLYLDGLRGIEKNINELSVEGFQELKHLYLENCPSVKYVVRSLEWLPCSAFTMLESLFLENLVNLEKICHGHLAPESFSKLKVVKVKNCGKVRNLFYNYLTKAFSQLEEITIRACEMFQEIVADVRMKGDVDETMMDIKVEIPNLQRLKLHGLPKITSIFRTVNKSLLLPGMNSEITPEDGLGTLAALRRGCQISFPKLKTLELSQLPNLEEIWWRGSSLDLESLRSLIVKDCGKVSNIITSQSLIQLQNLESLTIDSCRAVTEVFDLEELNLGANASILPQLREIELTDLPDLKCLWNRNPTAVLPLRNLKSLKIMRCNSLKYLFPLSVAKALEPIKEIEVVECMMMEAIIEKEDNGEAKNTVIFPSLSSILLKTLPSLTCFSRGNYSISFPNLKKLEIDRCAKMKSFSTDDYLMSNEVGEHFRNGSATMAFQSFFNKKVLLPNLEDLKLVSMGSLEMIWHNMNLISESSSFGRLIYMHVEECKKLTSVFPSVLTERIKNNLKRAKIRDCPSVEVILEVAASNPENMNCQPTAMVLYELEDLELDHLPELKCMSEADSHVIVCFPSLKEIFVRGCDNLTYLLPNAAARYLLKLETLGLGECRNMREVFVNKGDGRDLTEPILFPRLKTLKLRGLNSLISFSSGSCPFDFPFLWKLRIDQCDSFKTFIMRPVSDDRTSSNQILAGDLSSATTFETLSPALFDEKVEFPRLEELFLGYIGNLRELWEDELPLGYSFSKLKSLTVEHCKNVTSIFQSKVMGRFQNLKTLKVLDCDSLEVVFLLQGEIDGSAKSVPLRELEMRGLPEMKRLWDKDPQGSLTFDKLERVVVNQCAKLEYLFPTSVARGMLQLQKIDIMDCGTQEELVARSAVETPGDDGVQLLFPQLNELRFRRLPNLKRLLPGNYSLEWSTLKILYAYGCGKVKIFASDLPPSSEEDDSDCQQALLSIEQVIPNLECLGFGSEDVSMIQVRDLPDCIFGNLKYLCLAWFEEGSSSVGFPSRFLLDRFPYLQIKGLAFSNGSFDEIFPDEVPGPQGTIISYKDGYSNDGKYSKALKNLTELALFGLRNLRYVCKEDLLAAEVLMRIERLHIESCHRLTALFPTASDSFQNITNLYIGECDGLRYLMTPSAARCMSRLHRMTIRNCEMLQQVIAANGSGAEDEISFPNLMSLQLECLPILNSFSTANCSISFPLLGTASISKCPNMKTFSEGAVSTPYLYSVDSTFYGKWYGDLNTYVRRISSYYK